MLGKPQAGLSSSLYSCAPWVAR